MRYADITRNDANPIKRYLQRTRLGQAITQVQDSKAGLRILDFGAGDGELCRQLAQRFPDAKIVCYEPAGTLHQEAVENLAGLENAIVACSVDDLEGGRFDYVFCMEVFEHLPPAATMEAIRAIDRLLADDGLGVVSVPLEVHAPALVKGLFRMTRRYRAFDARIIPVIRATLGAPPRDRLCGQLEPGLAYYFDHLGFDHRLLHRLLHSRFASVRVLGSPLGWLGTWLNSQVFFLCRKNRPLPADRSPLPTTQRTPFDTTRPFVAP